MSILANNDGSSFSSGDNDILVYDYLQYGYELIMIPLDQKHLVKHTTVIQISIVKYERFCQ